MYTFFDVETPNGLNNRICSIAVIQTDNFGNICTHGGFLVNPECNFGDINVAIHHITEDMCKTKPNFALLWDTCLKSLFTDTCIVAHNAAFDLSVLAKTLQYYQREIPDIKYICTLALSKKMFPNLNSYKLTNVCKMLGIADFTNHDALADTLACAKLFWEVRAKGAKTIPKRYILKKPICS